MKLGHIALLEFVADDQTSRLVEGDEPPVEGAIMKCIEGNSVSWVCASIRADAPWDDVTGYEQFRDRDVYYGAASFMARKNGLAKKSL